MPSYWSSRYLLNLVVVLMGVILIVLPSVNVNSFIEPTLTPKFIFLGYAMAIAFFFTFFYLFLGRQSINVSISPIDIFVVIMFLYIILNRYYIHINHGFSLRFLELSGLFFYYFLLRWLPAGAYPFILLSIIAGGFLQITEGFLQLSGLIASNHAYFPVTGSFFNPGAYAGYLALIAVLSFGVYGNRNFLIDCLPPTYRPYEKFFTALFTWLPMVVFAGCIIILPALRSRASWFALFAGLSLIWIMHKKKGSVLKSGSVKYLILLSILMAGAVYFLYQFKKDSANGRLLIYKISAELAIGHPGFGVGFDGFKTYYMSEQQKWFERTGIAENADSTLADNTFYAFNEPLQFLVENGISGLLLVLAFLILYSRFNSTIGDKTFRIISYSLLVTDFIFGLFTYMSDNLPMKMIMALAFAMLAKSDAGIITRNILLPERKPGLAVIPFACCLFLTWYGFICVNKLKNGFYTWGNAQAAYMNGDYSESVKTFSIIYPQFQNNGEYLAQYAKSLSMTGNDTQAMNILKQAKLYLNSDIIETAMGDCEKKTGQLFRC